MFSLSQLVLQFLFIFLESLDHLFVLLVNSAFPIDLTLQLMDSLFELNLVVKQFVDLTHAVSDHNFQLLLLQVEGLHFFRYLPNGPDITFLVAIALLGVD